MSDTIHIVQLVTTITHDLCFTTDVNIKFERHQIILPPEMIRFFNICRFCDGICEFENMKLSLNGYIVDPSIFTKDIPLVFGTWNEVKCLPIDSTQPMFLTSVTIKNNEERLQLFKTPPIPLNLSYIGRRYLPIKNNIREVNYDACQINESY